MQRYLIVISVMIFAAAAFYWLMPSNLAQRIGITEQQEQTTVAGHDTVTVNEDNRTLPGETVPVITGGRLDLDSSGDMDVVRVKLNTKGRKDAAVVLIYEWSKNGLPAGNGDSLSGIKRGDKLSVKVTPYDGKLYGFAETFSMEIGNTTPRITGIKQIAAAENSLTYQVVANDADGDTLSYSMAEAPEGMTVDSNGVIHWSFDKDSYGKTIMAKVKVSDGHGGETVGNINFKLGSE